MMLDMYFIPTPACLQTFLNVRLFVYFPENNTVFAIILLLFEKKVYISCLF